MDDTDFAWLMINAAHYRDMLASQKVEDCLLLIKEILVKQREAAQQKKRQGILCRFQSVEKRPAWEISRQAAFRQTEAHRPKKSLRFFF